MKFGILDQIPVAKHQSPTEALEQTVKIAQEAEKIGYDRFWLAEHHNSDRLASSAPEIVWHKLPHLLKRFGLVLVE